MPRPRKQAAKPNFTPGQAHYVLERLISDRRVSSGEVSRYVSEMHNEIGSLERRLQALRDAAGSVAGSVVAMVTPKRRGRPPAAVKRAGAAVAAGRRRRRTNVTPERKASQQLQGRYLGLIRQIPPSRRAQYQRLAKEKGREAAIKEMTSALGR